jgi:Protein of unknown function (DUF1566)
MDFLQLFLILFPSVTGLYLIVGACVPFDFVTIFTRATIQIKPMDTRKARIDTFFSGVSWIVAAIFFVVLFYGMQMKMYFHNNSLVRAQARQRLNVEAPKSYVYQGGLTWMPIGPYTKTWSDANAYCNNTAINGQSGWRLPTKDELSALFASGAMTGQGWTLYDTWSSTSDHPGYHYIVTPKEGTVYGGGDTGQNYVTCVR